MSKVIVKYRQIFDCLSLGYDPTYTMPGRDGKPSIASVLAKLFSVKAEGKGWSETALRIADIQGAIGKVYDKGSAYDTARLAILERYKPIVAEEGQILTAEQFAENGERERKANEEFQFLLETEAELDISLLEGRHLETLPAFNANEIRAIRWMLV